MDFVPTKEYREVTLAEGLKYIEAHPGTALYSDGLSDNEYIYYDNDKGFRYEDRCLIGKTYDTAFDILIAMEWVMDCTFYVKTNEYMDATKPSAVDSTTKMAIDEFAERLTNKIQSKYSNGNITCQYMAMQTCDWIIEIAEEMKNAKET